MRCRQSLAKTKNQLQSQDLGATGGMENITEGLSGLSLVSCLNLFMKHFYPVENLNAFSELSLLRPFQGFNPCGTRACPG